MAAENSPFDKDSPRHKAFITQIDRQEYGWPEEKIAGTPLRRLPPTLSPSDRDLFQVVSGHAGRKIKEVLDPGATK